MNFKLDENLHPENGELLRERGHDFATVHDQGLRGHEDQGDRRGLPPGGTNSPVV